MKKWRKRMIWTIGIVAFIAAFWFYNFRWVEFIPCEPNIRENPKYGVWIERKEWITKERIECFKKQLRSSFHDYKTIDGKLYIRAYLQRDKNTLMMNMIYGWGGDPKFDRPCTGNFGGAAVYDGFFRHHLPYSIIWLGDFLDRIAMWNGDKPADKQ